MGQAREGAAHLQSLTRSTVSHPKQGDREYWTAPDPTGSARTTWRAKAGQGGADGAGRNRAAGGGPCEGRAAAGGRRCAGGGAAVAVLQPFPCVTAPSPSNGSESGRQSRQPRTALSGRDSSSAGRALPRGGPAAGRMRHGAGAALPPSNLRRPAAAGPRESPALGPAPPPARPGP